ncbi:InlB B-repeat-containing protein [Acholeplasma laidlawii]|uniref:InlB B-repeat-containing protein n=2 Tax=Acholeplasma laidlawii TaxID=2148 RepID=A0A553IGC6_ACHLA|nr:InlB B-repeat-containing protein [Acholeplasma laidlawii]ABX81867.1 hypothetical surface-anchored protein [Acholeplasma laidlawii PG-8A]NWH12237.1 InlB B-repeat-containing protein [Acholeplasma laidlawii]NWH13623.1 InlB B-repeat-containing protein [Acholeplasma laidlawii]NWH14210.1 InlB B-repeat-containing protein [Acholeplasma laidlawii]OAN20184.1 hypothetical protein A2I99_02465 [Acholeplasma laidlawii]
MKFLEGIQKFVELITIKIPMSIRILFGVIILAIVGIAIYNSITNQNPPTNNPPLVEEYDENNNFLYEEFVFADEIFMKVVGINAVETEDEKYMLNLSIRVEQWNTDINVNQQDIKSEYFELRLVDMYARSNMSIFMEALANATFSAMLSGAIGGDINVIEETLGFAEDYITGSIENAVSNKNKVIKGDPNQFETFEPYRNNGVSSFIELSFLLTDEFLNSTQVMVLSIDTWDRIEQNVFLILRPNLHDYNVHFDFNGGTSSEIIDINISKGQIEELPTATPYKEGYQFLYWSSVKDSPETKIRDLYFYASENELVYTVYANYQELVPLDEYININEDTILENGVYTIKITNASFSNEATTLNKNDSENHLIAPQGSKYLILNVSILKTEGKNHTLDNDNDFHLENTYINKDISKYYGFIDFASLRPINDYSWIDLEIKEPGIYEFNLVFEVSENMSLVDNILVLEIDFFIGYNAVSILLKD